MSINETQRKIYEFLVQRSADGIPPSVREIGAAVGLRSTSSVQSNLDALEEAGYIQRDPLLKRSIRIMGQAERTSVLSSSIKGSASNVIRVPSRYTDGAAANAETVIEAAAAAAVNKAAIFFILISVLSSFMCCYAKYNCLPYILTESLKSYIL